MAPRRGILAMPAGRWPEFASLAVRGIDPPPIIRG